MEKTTADAVEYRGHYIVKDMIEPNAFERSNATSAENIRFAIMKVIDGERKAINYALSEEAAREKIDGLVGAELRRDEQSQRRASGQSQ